MALNTELQFPLNSVIETFIKNILRPHYIHTLL